MSIQDRLQINHENLLKQYHANIETVSSLQATLLRDILPFVSDELRLGPEATEWAKFWLYDTSTLFRILKRHNFTRSFALEAVRKNLFWRLNNLQTPPRHAATNFLQCLPSSILDPFDRPIIILKMVDFNQTFDGIKPWILQTFESLRINLERLNDNVRVNPVLQYMVLLDLEGLLFQNINIELIAWTLREVIPRFPGMLAGVFILNYSWAHSSLWSIIKRLLPPPALSRVFFPTNAELLEYFTPSALPQEYGGTLPLIRSRDPLWQDDVPTTIHDHVATYNEAHPSRSRPNATTYLPSTSLLNPFFGYPVSQSNSSTILPHGRRRKRDLVETLVFLFWVRWRKHITFSLLLVTLVAIIQRRQLIGSVHPYGRLLR